MRRSRSGCFGRLAMPEPCFPAEIEGRAITEIGDYRRRRRRISAECRQLAAGGDGGRRCAGGTGRAYITRVTLPEGIKKDRKLCFYNATEPRGTDLEAG